MTAADALRSASLIGRRVVVISQDDRAAPLAVADHLAGSGHDVTLVYESTAPRRMVYATRQAWELARSIS